MIIICGDFMIRHFPKCGEEVTEYDIVCLSCGGGITFVASTEDFESNDDVEYTTYMQATMTKLYGII